MSSEGSVSTSTSSRIRQFGLYRTIDARTEEFLRLSRKRQIKQGCVCAVISTAITVTVVITVFLVYMEYGMKTEPSEQAVGKSTWIGLINDSLASAFEEKFSKSKSNFDRTTIKLLPILIKALKQNRYLEKILEDYSSSSPAYDGKVTTEFSFKKDIFLNRKSWIKKPTSRIYTIEYKSSPIVFVRKPARDVGYFAKTRKIRDYKRMMDYLKKMINDKGGVGANAPNLDLELNTQTEKQLKNNNVETDRPKLKPHDIREKNKITTDKSTKNELTQSRHENIVSCNCPRHLSLLLSKLFTSIQQLMPVSKMSEPCQQKNVSKTFINDKLLSSNSTFTSNTSSDTSRFITTSEKPLKLDKRVVFSEFNNVFIKRVQPSSTQIPETGGKVKATISPLFDFQLTTTRNQLQPTEASERINLRTRPMSSKVDNFYRRNKITTSRNNTIPVYVPAKSDYQTIPEVNPFLQFHSTTNSIRNTIEPEITIPISIKTYYEKLIPHSTEKSLNELYGLNMNSIELLKLKSMTPNQRIGANKKNGTHVIQDKIAQYNNNQKQGSFNLTEKTSTEKYPNRFIAMPSVSENLDLHNINSANEPSTLNENKSLGQSKKKNLSTMRNQISKMTHEAHKEKIKHNSNYVTFENILLEDEIEKMIHEDEYQQEENTKHFDGTKLLERNLTTKTAKDTDKADWLNFNDRLNIKSNSMMPQSRSSYLEIDRNNWKHEDNKDYDTDMRYNMFDLL